MSEQPPWRDEDTERTQPVGQTWSDPAQAPPGGYDPGPGYGGPGYGSAPGYSSPGYGGSGYGGWYAAPQGYPPPQRRSSPPGWIWPLVAGLALVVGLAGGAIGGALAGAALGGTSVGGGSGILEVERRTAPPLPADNASIAAVAEKLLPSTVQILAKDGPASGATGSGFVLDEDGHVITNNHVVAGAASGGTIRVVSSTGERYDAEIVGRSPVYDLAVLQVSDPAGLEPAALGSSRQMYVGETVVAFGSPLGLDSTVTSGILSALDRPVTTGDADESSYINALQTDAAINPGNSGGPLVNLAGEVVGVNSAIATTGGFAADTGGNIGVGFAIPVEQVQVTADQILRTGEAQYPIIGATVQTGGSALAASGARIETVSADSPAAAGGLEDGDLVVGVEGTPVTDGIALIVAIRTYQPGETITLSVRRKGERRDVDITLDGKVG